MTKDTRPSMARSVNLTAALVFIFVTAVCSVNFVNQMSRAHHKELWLDESFSLKNTVQDLSYTYLIFEKADHTETNPAPLDFIFVKILDDIRPFVGQFGLSHETYCRLWANFIMHFSGALLCLLFILSITASGAGAGVKIFQLALLSFLPFAYLFRPMAYHYTAEVRPYALWFSLWLLSVGVLLLYPKRKWPLFVCMLSLALTMVGSVFQILCVAAAYFVCAGLEEGWRKAFVSSLKVFALPLGAVVFYAFPASYGDRTISSVEQEWAGFFSLWQHEATIIPMMLLAAGSFLFAAKDRRPAAAPLAVLLIFLAGPIIFWITKSRGYFVTDRQYIYYDIHRAAFLLCAVQFMPFYLEKLKRSYQKIICAIVVLLVFTQLVYSKKHVNRFKEATDNASSFVQMVDNQ